MQTAKAKQEQGQQQSKGQGSQRRSTPDLKGLKENPRPYTALEIIQMPEGEEKYAEAMYYCARLLRFNVPQSVIRNWADRFGLDDEDWEIAFLISHLADYKPSDTISPALDRAEFNRRVEEADAETDEELELTEARA